MKTREGRSIANLGDFLQQRFGGMLHIPVYQDPLTDCEDFTDLTARLVNIPMRVSDREVVTAARDYYTSTGGTLSPVNKEMEMVFGVTANDFNALVSLSNETNSERSRILFTIINH